MPTLPPTILHRIVPLISQALTQSLQDLPSSKPEANDERKSASIIVDSPEHLARAAAIPLPSSTNTPLDRHPLSIPMTSHGATQIWSTSFRLLANPQLLIQLGQSTSIWLPFLLKGLEPFRPPEVILAGLELLRVAAEVLGGMKGSLIRPLKALARETTWRRGNDGSELLDKACLRLGMKAVDVMTGHQLGTGPADNKSPKAPSIHPLLEGIRQRNLPRQRSVKQAWSHTLLAPTHENSTVWLRNLFQASLESCGVDELVITSRLGKSVNGDLFQTAFMECYHRIESDPVFKDVVDERIVHLFNDRTLSKDITTVLLDLLAFFHKDGKKFNPAVDLAAEKCALEHFKGDLNMPLPGIALWYEEQESLKNMPAENLASLVGANIRIGASGYDSAWSTLLWLRDDFHNDPDPRWITQLSHWQSALDAQDAQDKERSMTTFSSLNTRMICHHALGQFERSYELAQLHYDGLSDNERRKTSHWATAAAWHMGDYESMADYLAFHPKGTSKSLYKAIIDVYHGQYASAFHHISKAQTLSYDELQAQLTVGPQVAIKTLAKTELLVELNEAIQYKSQPELRSHIMDVWRARFKRSHPDANSWLKRLQVWTLAVPPITLRLQDCYLDAAKLCESIGMHEAAKRIIEVISPSEHIPGCKVEYTKLRFEWKKASDHHNNEAMQAVVSKLHAHTNEYYAFIKLDKSQVENEGLGLRPLSCVQGVERATRGMLARRYHRLAQWTEVLQGSFYLTDPDSEVYRYYSLAYKLDEEWYSGANSLAEAAMAIFEANGFERDDPVALNGYVVPAIRGLFQAVRTNDTPERKIRAILRVVTLWFRYGEASSVLSEVQHQLRTTPISSWLVAIPQLIARLGTKHAELQGALMELLKRIASQYPHAVIWPLLTASQTRKAEHQGAARVITDYICTMSDGTRLVDQAEMVGRELIRTSISWLERWRSLIDQSLPRQELMEIPWEDIPSRWEEELLLLAEPETPDEETFAQQYGNQLAHINRTLLRYKATKQLSLVTTAYSELYKLYGEIDVQLNQWRLPGTTLQLANAAPRLLSLRDCILIVPGQYDSSVKLDDQAFIDSFHPTVDILSSKQLPRKLVIRSHKDPYTFLLKGNEDLRGDERVMQLFTLVNTLLNHESEAFSRNLHMLPYEVIPLSPDAGLVSWVPNTHTLQAMIANNREIRKRNHITYRETASILGYDPDTFDPLHDRPHMDQAVETEKFQKLPVATKVERLKAAMSHSDQNELKDVMWQRSPSAEIWIRRRTNFARTVGVGSFVGHIIGLGDRHGSNILVDQLTWGALHIDFGDLFGVAQERAFLPEKVPFRLSRMMTNAFELAGARGHVSPGSRGSFKQASVVTMGVLRDSRSSLLAMLEAFLYDPLLSWTTSTLPSAAIKAGGKQEGGARLDDKADHPRQFAASVQLHRARALHPEGFPESVSPSKTESDNESIVAAYLEADSYMAKVTTTGMTNSKALQVLAQIERKLSGYNTDSLQPLTIAKQVQELIEEATKLENLAQGYVLGWVPHW